MPPIYLDNAATTALHPDVRAAMEPYLTAEYGNPSSRHPLGVRAREAIDQARRQVARAVGAEARWVTFTSGGTEANNLGVLGLARAARSKGLHVLVGATEHASVRASAAALAEEGFEVEPIALDDSGAIDQERFAEQLREDTVLVAQMLANNEFGTVHPIAHLARIVRARAPRARIHVDCVQGLGKLECSPEELGADSVSLSAHKVHGPKGVGALVLAGECPVQPLVYGGGQEQALRPGTENVAGIVGFGVAADLAERGREAAVASMAACRTTLVELLRGLPGVRVFEPGREHLPSLVSVRVPWAPAEVVMHHLEARGVFVSSGSACQSTKAQASPIALALGLSADEAKQLLRISFASSTTTEEVTRAAAALTEVAAELAAVTR